MDTAALKHFLVEHDEIRITLTTDGFEVLVPGKGYATLEDLSSLPEVLGDDSRWTSDNPRITGDWKRMERSQPVRCIVLKPSRDVDLYVEWYSSADNTGLVGTRSEMLEEGHSVSRLLRADEYGTSARPGPYSPGRSGGWDDNGFVVSNQDYLLGQGWLPRDLLLDFARAKKVGDEQAAARLVQTLDEEDDES